jgi:hypothetical protein
MSNEQVAPRPEAPGGDAPQAMVSEVTALREEAQAMARAAATGWRLTGLVFVLVLAVVVIALSALHKNLRDHLEPRTVVQLGVAQVNEALREAGAPADITSLSLHEWVADRVKASAPEVVSEYVKPELEKLPDRLDELRVRLVGEVAKDPDYYVDKATRWLVDEALPAGRGVAVDEARDRVGELVDAISEQLGVLVAEVMAEHREQLQRLEDQDWGALRRSMQQQIEREMGPILDEMFAAITAGVRDARAEMELLVDAYQQHRLTAQQSLEVQLVRLVRALFEQKAIQHDVEVESLPERAARALTPPDVVEAVEALTEEAVESEAAPAAPPAPPPNIGIEGLPPEAREAAAEGMQEGRRRAEAAQEEEQ